MAELSRQLIEGLPKNGATDPIEYYRRPFVGALYRERINMGLRLLGRRHYDSALEVGYGAGAVLLALSSAASKLSGIDLDADPSIASGLLAQRNVKADLRQGSVFELPWGEGMFDLAVCFSVFEHLTEYRAGLREVARVLRPGGHFLLGMPAVNRLMELGFLAIGFKGIDDHHVTRPMDVRKALGDTGFRIRSTRYLGIPQAHAALYTTWLLERT
ncbi:MAG: class I SAM-dependent methyltransferase [Polyangiaceae bacterium]